MTIYTLPLSEQERDALDTELRALVQKAWFTDRDPDTSADAVARARKANYDLAGFVMHNVDAILGKETPQS